jgi:hypothetical protein
MAICVWKYDIRWRFFENHWPKRCCLTRTHIGEGDSKIFMVVGLTDFLYSLSLSLSLSLGVFPLWQARAFVEVSFKWPRYSASHSCEHGSAIVIVELPRLVDADLVASVDNGRADDYISAARDATLTFIRNDRDESSTVQCMTPVILVYTSIAVMPDRLSFQNIDRQVKQVIVPIVCARSSVLGVDLRLWVLCFQ